MKVLILINCAIEHRPFYAMVGDELRRAGHEVVYALDSHYTDYLHPETDLGDAVRYFSDYFREHFERRTLPPGLDDVNLSAVLFPDVERLTCTRFMWRDRDGYYESLIANLAHFFVELFDEYHFDAVVYENVSNAFAYMAYEIAQHRGARYVGFLPSRLPGRMDVLDRAWSRDSRLEATFRAVRSGELVPPADACSFVQEYLANFDEKEPDYMVGHAFEMGLVQRYVQARPLQRFLRTIRYRVANPEDHFYAYQVGRLWMYPEQIGREMLRHAKRRELDRRLYQRGPDLSRPYFVYPLQFHPESSTSVDGPAFTHELSNILGIAQNLPFGYSLYVKDHRHAAGRQPLSFYEKVAHLPNAVLVHPDYHTKTLLRHARAVVCVTSTMGYEALVLGKPVFLLGHPFYEFFPGCVRVPSFDGAFEAFSRHGELQASPADVAALVTAYYLCSVKGSMSLTHQYQDREAAAWVASTILEAVAGRAEVATGPIETSARGHAHVAEPS